MKQQTSGYNFKQNLIEAAIRKETSDETTREMLAGKHAIKMLEILDNILEESLTPEETITKITQVLRFAHVPPHI